MRAARTPPEPAPMTNRSTSCGMSHLPRESRHRRRASDRCGPSSSSRRASCRSLPRRTCSTQSSARASWLSSSAFGSSLDQLLAERRLVEGEHVLELLLGETRRVELARPRRAARRCAARTRRAACAATSFRSLRRVRIGLQEDVLVLLDHARRSAARTCAVAPLSVDQLLGQSRPRRRTAAAAPCAPARSATAPSASESRRRTRRAR